MLNRTNLTLSALSNRLNLGTRSLALNTSVKHGDQTLRIRHLHHDVMRSTMAWYVVSPFVPDKYDIPAIPGSIIPGQQQQPNGCTGQEASRPVCPPCVEPAPSDTWFLSPGSLGEGSRESRSASPATARPGTARKRRPGCTLRTVGDEVSGRVHAARRAAAGKAPAASAKAIAARTGG